MRFEQMTLIPPVGEGDRIANPMNLTAAELRREYGKALAMIAQLAEQIAEKDREIAKLKAILEPAPHSLGLIWKRHAEKAESREAALRQQLAEQEERITYLTQALEAQEKGTTTP